MSQSIELPPFNLDAELSVLGCLLHGGSKTPEVIELLLPEDFHTEAASITFRAIRDVFETSDGVVDVLLVADELERKGLLADIGGAEFLHQCFAAVPYDAHVVHYVGIVKSHSRRREAIAIGEKLIREARDMTRDDDQLVESAHDAAMKMAECLRVKHSRPRPLSEHVAEVIEAYASGHSTVVYWGIPDIDFAIGGVMPGELIVIGARPGMGKTLTGLQWVDEAASRGIPGLIISEEMSAPSLAMRTISSMTGVNSNNWNQQIDFLRSETAGQFSFRATTLIAEKVATVSAAERAIERAVQSHQIRIVAVDYAQLLQGNGETKEQRVSDVSQRMKAIAMKHDLVVLLLAQLNRQIEQRKDAPQLSDLRDSGGLEQDADVALFPFWPWKLDSNYEDRNEYRVYIRKNRNRGIGDSCVQLRINPSRQRLEGADEVHVPDHF